MGAMNYDVNRIFRSPHRDFLIRELVASIPISDQMLRESNMDVVTWLRAECAATMVEMRKKLLADPPAEIDAELTYVTHDPAQYPATWWDAFKLKAISQGNPIFDPQKIKYATTKAASRRVMKTVRVFPVYDPNFTIRPSDVSLGRVRYMVES